MTNGEQNLYGLKANPHWGVKAKTTFAQSLQFCFPREARESLPECSVQGLILD